MIEVSESAQIFLREAQENLVREEGVEPSCLATLASETSASAIPPPPQ